LLPIPADSKGLRSRLRCTILADGRRTIPYFSRCTTDAFAAPNCTDGIPDSITSYTRAQSWSLDQLGNWSGLNTVIPTTSDTAGVSLQNQGALQSTRQTLWQGRQFTVGSSDIT